MKKYQYDLVVIGAGAAGLIASYTASAANAKVALIERHQMGGDCLYTGCVPSKALLKSAKLAHMAKHSSQFGIHKMSSEIDFSKLMSRVHQAIAQIEPNDSPQRYAALGVECIKASATINHAHEVALDNGQVLTTRSIIIATGASPFIPPIEGLDASHERVLTSDSLWSLKELPTHLVILGGGPIGCEMAQAFIRLGSKVSLIEKSELPMIIEGTDVAEHMHQCLRDEGVEFYLGHELKSIDLSAEKVSMTLIDNQQNERTLECDKILVATGRKANVNGLGLEQLGIELSPRSTVKINHFLQTNISNIFACGDVAGPYQFTHAAGHQAWYSAMNALFGGIKKFKIDYHLMPRTVYCDPEIAAIGYTQAQVEEKGLKHEVTLFPIAELDRAITESETTGFIKVITKGRSDKILGVTIVASHASDMLAEFSLAMKHGIGLNGILGTIHPYPSWTDANKMTAGRWRKKHIPAWAPKLSAKVLGWLNL